MEDNFFRSQYFEFRKLLCWRTKTDGGRYYQDIIHDPPKNQELMPGEQRTTRRYLRIKGRVANNAELLKMAKDLFGSSAIRISTSKEGLWNGEPEPILHIKLPDILFTEET